VNDIIRLNNGQVTGNIFQAIDCLLGADPPQDQFLIPMIKCGGSSTEGTVSGFATVEIECVQAPGVVNKPCAVQSSQCTGGDDPGKTCTTDSDCPGTCKRSGRGKVCTGTTQSCNNNRDCQGVCMHSSLCVGGTNAGHTCTSDADCPGGTCGTTGKFIKLRAIFNAGVPGPPGGCTGCGSGFIALVG
jgi:hypothetical protein